MKRALAWLAGLLLLAAPAFGGFTLPTQLGVANGTTTAVITTGAAAAPGSLIVVVVSSATSNIAVTSVADSAGNCSGAYTAYYNTNVASRPTAAVFYCANTGSNLAIGGTITVTVPSTDKVAATAFAVAGMAASPIDTTTVSANGGSGTTATTVTTAALAQNGELVVGALALSSTSSALTTNGYTAIGGTSSANGSVWAAYGLACSTTAAPWTPGWTTSNAYMSDVVSFKFSAAVTDTMCGVKAMAYPVLQYGTAASQSADKANGYVVLLATDTKISASKSNLYVVLQTPANTAKGFFHAFP